MAQQLVQSRVDISDSVIESPSHGTPFYFFFGSIKEWEKNLGIVDIILGTTTKIVITDGFTPEAGETMIIHGGGEFDGWTGEIESFDPVTREVEIFVDSTNYSSYSGDGYATFLKSYLPEMETQDLVRNKIVGLKRVTGDMMCHIVQRIDWEQDQYFDVYDSTIDLENKKYYAFNGESIFICLNNAKGGPSRIRPQGNSSQPQTYSDGYSWLFVQRVSNADMAKFGSDIWLPVRPIDVPNLRKGSILGVKVVTRGLGYKHGDAVRLVGDGLDGKLSIARFDANGGIDSVSVDDGGFSFNWADAWVEAGPTSAGSGAVLRPILSPNYGDVVNSIQSLNAHTIRFVYELNGDEEGTLYTGPIHSIGMLRPLREDYRKFFNSVTIDSRSRIEVKSNGGLFEVGEEITGSISGAKAICAGSSENVVYYVERNGPRFIDGEIITSGVKTSLSTKILEFDMTAIAKSNIVFIENLDAEYVRNPDQLDRFVVTIIY